MHNAIHATRVYLSVYRTPSNASITGPSFVPHIGKQVTIAVPNSTHAYTQTYLADEMLRPIFWCPSNKFENEIHPLSTSRHVKGPFRSRRALGAFLSAAEDVEPVVS